jgi:hypothetical protein
MALRILMNGSTAAIAAGGYYPPEWGETGTGPGAYPQVDWANVIKQFEVAKTPHEYDDDKKSLLNMLCVIRNSHDVQ